MYERLLTSGLLRHEERETILKSLSYHTMIAKFPTAWSHPNFLTVCLNSRQPKCLSTWPKVNLPTNFFKIFKFSGPSLPIMTSFTLQPHFLSGIYYDNCDCHILCARAQNCTQCYAPELRAE